MATAGPSFAGTGANSNDGGNTAWTNPTNVQGDTTGTAATCAPGSSVGHTSQLLRASNFGFAVPTGATVDGITVEVEKQASASNRSAWSSCRILKAGAETGTAKESGGSAWSNSKAFQTLGGVADLWGTTWTPSEINASGFGVSIKVRRTATQAVTDSVFRVRITVSYTPESHEGSATTTGGGISSMAAQSVRLFSATATASGLATVDAEREESQVETHEASIVITGGGVAALFAGTDRQAGPSVTGAGAATMNAVMLRGMSVASTGGGSASLSTASARLLAALMSGGGVLTHSAGTLRQRSVVATGAGRAVILAPMTPDEPDEPAGPGSPSTPPIVARPRRRPHRRWTP